jgi:hypothetical protein
MAWCAGRGLMTEAVGLAVGFAFEMIRLHRVEANIQPENTQSIALVQRLGFTCEGYSPRYLHIGGAWRDHGRWARLADQGWWEQSSPLRQQRQAGSRRAPPAPISPGLLPRAMGAAVITLPCSLP